MYAAGPLTEEAVVHVLTAHQVDGSHICSAALDASHSETFEKVEGSLPWSAPNCSVRGTYQPRNPSRFDQQNIASMQCLSTFSNLQCVAAKNCAALVSKF